MAQIDDDLMTWDDVRGLKNWSGIFIGNGASVAVWQNFNYGSLFNQAKNLNDEDKRLSNEDLLLFEEQDTHNFEQVLGDLATARNVCRILGKPHDEIDARYRSIQVALFEAVKSIHVSWEECESAGVLTKLGTYFKSMKWVFSTNYDLLLYWSLMHVNANPLDFFFGEGLTFDAAETDVYSREDRTQVFYLHGSVHIFKDRYGQTSKIASSRDSVGRSLLDILQQFQNRERIPLFVAEGNWKEKMATIRGSSYLTFCRQKFGTYRGPLVVFGNSLSQQDSHLLTVLQKKRERSIAFGVYPHQDPHDIIDFKTRMHGTLTRQGQGQLLFFDSTTHPIGDPALLIPS